MDRPHAAAPELEVIPDVAAAWAAQGHTARISAMRRAAQALKERFASEPPVVSVRTFERYTIAYPVRFGFWGTAMVPIPFAIIRNRSVLVQFRQRGDLRTLIFNPSDETAVPRVPFVVRQREQKGVFGRMMFALHGPLEPKLEEAGIAPEAVDYVACDHFHFQDLSRLVNAAGGEAARFPRAKLLAQRREWDQWDDLHPIHQAFAVPDAKRDVDRSCVALLDADLRLGDGVMLVRTPGHTAGNQTLFFKTDTGVWGISENGICADNWSPRASRIPGVARRTEQHGLEVLPNMNTPESTADQYLSMVLERGVADRARGSDGFVQMFASFEVTPSWLTPGLHAHAHREVTFGELVRSTPRR
ncbi:MAG TPA: hypothetical protein VE093_43575 [Polyangiaceae bacterium]|nr:hypothetical protein [Polyangiaceae bacterium]